MAQREHTDGASYLRLWNCRGREIGLNALSQGRTASAGRAGSFAAQGLMSNLQVPEEANRLAGLGLRVIGVRRRHGNVAAKVTFFESAK